MQSAGTSIRVESYGASRPQLDRTQNEDAFIVGREPVPYEIVTRYRYSGWLAAYVP
jgi:hypothetical protein